MDKAIGNTPHENLFQKELYDLSQFPNSLSWSDDGLVSVVARNSVTVYIPNFEYMALYTVKWITIEQCNTIVSTETSSVLDFNEVCQWMNSKREEVVFRSCQWSPRGLSIEQESLLLIVLSEGSILIVERDINRLNNFDVGSFRLSLNGFSIPMDFGKIYSSMFRSKDESKTSIGAVWHSKIIKSPCRNFLVLFAFCETEVSAWLVSYDHCANRLEKTLKVDILAKSSVSACLSVYRTERICSAVSKETEVDKILVYLGCNDGSLLICELSFQINLYDHRTNKNNFGKFTTLCVLRPFQKPISSLFLIDAYLFCVVEQSLDCLDCTSLNTLKSNLTKVFARHKHSIMGVAESKQLDTGMANKLLASPKKTIVTCSCDFEIQSNLIQAQDNSKCTKEAKALSLNEETLNPLDMHFGVAADPSGYLLAFGKRAPGIGGNTRETQLTSSLRYDHLNVVWRACPYLESESMCNWASDSQLIAKIILDICTECEKEYSRASIPLLYWLSLEKCNEFAQNTQLLEAIRSNDELIVKLSTEKLENKRSTENYSDENNTLYHEQEVLKYEESDCSSSDSSIDGKKSSLSKGSKFVDGNAAKLNKKSRREGLDTIDKTSFQVLGDFSQKFFRCQPNELLLQHLNALLSGLNIAVLRLHNSKVVDEVTSDCCMNDILFSLPSDPDKLKKHLSILKTFHLLIFASIRMRMLDCEKALTWAIRIRNFLAFSSCLLSLERCALLSYKYYIYISNY